MNNKIKPNILFLMCDQLRADAINNSYIPTPNLDELKSHGVSFNNAYTPNAVCSPARASLMTGALPHNHNVRWVTHTVDRDQGNISLEYAHWAEKIKNAGYKTYYFGKWHVQNSDEINNFGCNYDYTYNSTKYKD